VIHRSLGQDVFTCSLASLPYANRCLHLSSDVPGRLNDSPVWIIRDRKCRRRILLFFKPGASLRSPSLFLSFSFFVIPSQSIFYRIKCKKRVLRCQFNLIKEMYQLTDKLIAHRWNRFDIVKEIEQIYISLKNIIYKYFSEDIRMHVHISANKFLLRNLSYLWWFCRILKIYRVCMMNFCILKWYKIKSYMYISYFYFR